MEYTTEFDEANGICILHVTGKLKRPDDSLILQRFARDFGEEHGCERFLFNLTKAEVISTTMDTYYTGTVPVDSDRRQTRQRIALVYSGDMDEHKFMENVAVNRGYNLRVFDRIDKAFEWLKPNRMNT